MSPAPSLVDLVRWGTLDAELAALAWLLVEGGLPLTVVGGAPLADRARVAQAILSTPPDEPFVLIDADADRAGLATLAARIRGGLRVGITLQATDLRHAMERLTEPPDGLAEDAVRRLGVVLVVASVPTTAVGPIEDRARIVAAHYLRPTERDPQGHIQRRPPAVLATWVPDLDAFDHFAWGMTPELADLVDRTQASFEELQSSRISALRSLAGHVAAAEGSASYPGSDPMTALRSILATEPARQAAMARGVAAPLPIRNPLTDPHVH
ncbi:MAG: hypothetical protein LH650_13800 [Chloroflexi bacterium]|nr:hypothetical protein [Chloroflexota bacterium]